MVTAETLEQLDAWYVQKFEEKYTPQVQAETLRIAKEAVEDMQGSSELKLSLDAMAQLVLTRPVQLDDARTYFSKKYSNTQRSIDQYAECGDEDVVNLFRKTREQLVRFVEEVDNMENTDHADIDRVFMQSFGSVDGYNNFWESNMDYLVRMSNAANPVLGKILETILTIKPAMFYMHEQMFSDLEKDLLC